MPYTNIAKRRVLERDIEAKVVKWAKDKGIKVKKKLPGEQLDRWFMLPGGRPFIIEFKVPGKKPTPLQQAEIDALMRLGYQVRWFDDADEAIKELADAAWLVGLHV